MDDVEYGDNIEKEDGVEEDDGQGGDASAEAEEEDGPREEYDGFTFEEMLMGDYAVIAAKDGSKDPYAFQLTIGNDTVSPWLLFAEVKNRCSDGSERGCI